MTNDGLCISIGCFDAAHPDDPDGFCRDCGIEATRKLNDREYWHRRALERKREQAAQT